MPTPSIRANRVSIHVRVSRRPDSARNWLLPNVLVLSSSAIAATVPIMLFETPHAELSDEEVAAVLRQTMASAERLRRHADLWLAGICAEYLVDGLRAAGLIVARPVQWRLHP